MRSTFTLIPTHSRRARREYARQWAEHRAAHAFWQACDNDVWSDAMRRHFEAAKACWRRVHPRFSQAVNHQDIEP